MKYLCLLFALILQYSFSSGQVRVNWTKKIEGHGSFSSPRVTDLNGDKIRDVVIGVGKNPFQPLDTGVMALNGRSGEVLWVAPSHDQVFGSPSFQDVTGDGVDDVFINGRSGVLLALNGKDGSRLWEFLPGRVAMDARGEGWFNFYNPQFVADVDGDGIKDILISSGGDVLVPAYDPKRPNGKIVVISGLSGKLLAEAKVPDGKETYMSVVAYPSGDPTNPNVVFGTGGETITGSLYITTLKEVLSGDLSKSISIANGGKKGFIAPPILADINADKKLDIIAMAVDGRMIAVDGASKRTLWSTGLRNTEAFASMAIGRLTNDTTPDFFAVVNTGIWPQMEYALSLVVDGKSGTIIKSDTVGYYQMVSPIAFDIDNNGFDEILLHTNFPENDPGANKPKYVNTLFLFDFKNRLTQRLGPVFQGAKQASTPWIGDVDDDGFFDVIMMYQHDLYNESIFGGFEIMRLNLGIQLQKPVAWGSYMGSSYDGIYHK